VNRAVFLDRDGTLVDDPGYLADPAAVHLLPSGAEAVRRLGEAGWLRIVVTNQSGIGRGLFTEEHYAEVARRVTELLAEEGASLTASYHCPHRPDAGCDCRKPGTALHRRAARDHQVDLAASWWIGDRLADLLPARALGGRGVLVRTGEGARHEAAAREAGFLVAADLAAAVEMVLGAYLLNQ